VLLLYCSVYKVYRLYRLHINGFGFVYVLKTYVYMICMLQVYGAECTVVSAVCTEFTVQCATMYRALHIE
jgi:hypothetical protein